jgi:hypothetical protein
MALDTFYDVPRTFYTTSCVETQVPMFFYDVSERRLNYFVDYDRVAPKLEGTGLVPCRFFNGKALVSLIFLQYRDVTIGPYDEVTITIVVRPKMLPDPRVYLPKILFKKRGAGWGNMGAYVLEMPVTIPAARAAGREIWGYPKFLTKIPNRLSGRKFEFGVLDPDTGESILSVKGETGPGIPTKAFDMVCFNNYRDAIWKIFVDADGWYLNARAKQLEVKVGTGSHRMAQNIRDLGLADLTPFVIQSADRLRTRLNPGRPVAEWKSPELPYRHRDEIAFEKKKMK